jgi:hypothetical protein
MRTAGVESDTVTNPGCIHCVQRPCRNATSGGQGGRLQSELRLATPRRDEMAMPNVETHTLFGWWKILSFQVEFEDTGERADTYGVDPLGHMVIERDRVITILTSRERPSNDPTALFETMIAYSGSCRVEDENKLIIKVDTAWHPAWIGTEQVRFFKVDSDVLSITTAWQTHPSFPGRMARGVLTAQRNPTSALAAEQSFSH